MAESIVALHACPDYKRKGVQEAVDALFALCGGIERMISPGQKVLIKLNLLMKRTPDRATTTHPEVARAVVCAVQRVGGIPILADSPGGPFTCGLLSSVYAVCGMEAVAEETGCLLNEDFHTITRYFPEGAIAKRFDLIGVLDTVDAVITVGKLKTHGLTTMTGCVKNLYGVIPGTMKVEYHTRYPQVERFSEMLVDLCACVRPCFAVLDAVEGMEGEGPSGGRPRRIGALLGGCDPHAVDTVAAQLIGLDPDQVTTLAAAKRMGRVAPYVLAGDPLEPLIVRDFDIPMRLKKSNWVALVNHLPQALRPHPVFKHKYCDGCCTCARSCPAEAIFMDEWHRPHVDLKRCIRCFCCQELCPKTDIEVKRNPIFSLLK